MSLVFHGVDGDPGYVAAATEESVWVNRSGTGPLTYLDTALFHSRNSGI